MIATPINETLPASTSAAVLIEIGDGYLYSDWAVQARESVDIHISDTLAMTKYWTIKADTAQSVKQMLGSGAGMFYARSGSTAGNIEVLPVRS